MGLLLYTVVLITLITVLSRILWKISSASVARYYLKFIYFGLATNILASASILLATVKSRESRNLFISTAEILLCCPLIGVTISLEGQENIVKNSGCVVLINHQSVLDLLVLAKLWSAMDNCRIIAKKEILYFPPFGLAAWLWGVIFIDRVKKEKARATVIKTGQIIKNGKARIIIFPEGTRNQSEKMLPFKKGAFHLAVASQCPIQPVVVNRYRFLGKYKFDDGHIRIKILPSVPTEGYSSENLNKLIEKTYKIMSDNIDILSKDR